MDLGFPATVPPATLAALDNVRQTQYTQRVWPARVTIVIGWRGVVMELDGCGRGFPAVRGAGTVE